MSIVLDGTTGLAGAATGALNGALGATTPSTVVATTVTATTGIVGTTTNNNAAVGIVGEYVEGTKAGAYTGITTGVAGNVVSISLTAGDWDVDGSITYQSNAGTTLGTVTCSISTTSATTADSYLLGNQQWLPAIVPASQYPTISSPTRRLSLASTTTVYLVYLGTFGVSTCGVGGIITARRVR